MADLFSFCLAIAAQIEGEPCPGEVHKLYPHGKCSLCSGSGKVPPEACEGEGICPGCDSKPVHTAQLAGPRNQGCSVCHGKRPITYHSPIVLICADWLEEGGDLRAGTLRGMAVHDDTDDTGNYLLCQGDTILAVPIPYGGLISLADAIRELLRRALGELTVPCQKSAFGNAVCKAVECDKCFGRGWVPARVETCKACAGKSGCPGYVTVENEIPLGIEIGRKKCEVCSGQGWVKVQEKTHA